MLTTHATLFWLNMIPIAGLIGSVVIPAVIRAIMADKKNLDRSA
jgi:hypothetical protein